MRNITLLSMAVAFCLSGCAENSAILKANESTSFFDDAVFKGETRILSNDTSGGQQYRVYQQAATGFIPGSIVREEVEQQAVKFCDEMSKKAKVIQESVSVPPHILGNFPRAEILFVCIDKPLTNAFEDQVYIRITNLKKLLDSGAITKEEYEQQKAKILGQ